MKRTKWIASVVAAVILCLKFAETVNEVMGDSTRIKF
jgi:hypothetical protein